MLSAQGPKIEWTLYFQNRWDFPPLNVSDSYLPNDPLLCEFKQPTWDQR